VPASLLDAGIKYVTNHLINCLPSYAVRHAWYHHVLGWYLGPDVAIFMGLQVHMRSARLDGKRVSIDSDSVISHDCLLSTGAGLVIGEHVLISPGVWLVADSHDIDDPQFSDICRLIVIDEYAWIGPRATILGGVTVGRGAIVLAGALVTQDVEPNSVVAGVPATVVGTREVSNPLYTLNCRPLFE
jgi:acetyltransferase-like isoleucine patch superfamily enzyme